MQDVTHPHNKALEIIVVGAGLGGLSAALSCQLAGHHVTVYESAEELKEIGAGLQVTPNGVGNLQRWGMPSWLWATQAAPSSFLVHRFDGRVLTQQDQFGAELRQRYGAPLLNLHRADLQLALAERARQLGVQIRLGQRVDDISRLSHGTPEITCASGLKASADLIIAADGLWSKCRSLYDAPQPTGDLAYRIVLDLADITDPELRAWVQNPNLHIWIGPGAHVVGYSLRGGTVYNIVLLVPDDLPEHIRRQDGSVEEMRAMFEGWDPVLTRFLGLVDGVKKWKLMHRKHLRDWVSPEGDLVFVGDACHPMLPYLGQGANLAIEDGAVLGLLLGSVASRDQLPQALDMYQQLRKARGEAVVEETFRQRDAWHMPDGPEQQARDALFYEFQTGGKPVTRPCPSRWVCPQVQPWLFGYDARAEVDAALARRPFLTSTPPRSSRCSDQGKDVDARRLRSSGSRFWAGVRRFWAFSLCASFTRPRGAMK
ncbi:FAD binding domain protein [Microdochium bolleyi]|uniref:FAD binding domain protein n=1 Tax=Microdochium bolleyi TaxID=196109 RepID=A0A136IQQ6_9PEZI|nr:FAD binding domain protein [Microdochium bolleyi]